MSNIVNCDVERSLIISPAGGTGIVNPGTATYYSATQENTVFRGIKVVIDITAISGGTTLTVAIRGRDPVSGKAVALLTSAALNSTGTTTLTLYPGIAVSASVSASDVLPAHWDISAAVGTANVITATIGASLMI